MRVIARSPSIGSAALPFEEDSAGALELLAFAAGQAGQAVAGDFFEQRVDDAVRVDGFVVGVFDDAETRAF